MWQLNPPLSGLDSAAVFIAAWKELRGLPGRFQCDTMWKTLGRQERELPDCTLIKQNVICTGKKDNACVQIRKDSLDQTVFKIKERENTERGREREGQISENKEEEEEK